MPTSIDELLRSETKHKERVYSTFDKMRVDAGNSARAREAYVRSGSYEDQDAFMAYGDRAAAWKRRHKVESLVQKLYRKPYFAHLEIRDAEYDDVEHFYLSDNESLDQIVPIDGNGTLIPFKQDKERPISIALFHLYQSKKADAVRYCGNDGSMISLSPVLICDDEIENRKLLSVMQLFPDQDILRGNADELLEQKLQENRSDPRLKNIIATLQQRQFQIIETDVRESFIVQGCAGSGKSQCLFHRLFFLRDVLSQDGWDKVLLLTPTQLFRNYSADLIRRYQLSDIADYSIAELYQTLLNRFDNRFRNRQYQFELTEEYLPDEYLHVVYSDEKIRLIEREIDAAILKYTRAACDALGESTASDINAAYISDLITKLDEEIALFDERESVLQQDSDYIDHRTRYDEVQKELEISQRTSDRLTKEIEQITEDEEKLSEAVRNYQDVKKELTQWMDQRDKRMKSAFGAVSQFGKRMDEGRYDAPARFMQKLAALRDITAGETYKDDEEYRQFLDEYYEQAEKELADMTKTQTSERLAKQYAKRKENIRLRLSEISETIESLSSELRQNEEWIREKAEELEGERSSRTLRRADMERARYFLARIESTVFEQEVWNALAPIKEKNNIQTLSIEELKEGQRRETRILYKSDLLFYIKIYMRLHPEADIPEYSLLCIDEGQDLHKADYDVLHQLYPKAAFNIFGDTEQVLHEDCGVSDWQRETGVGKVFQLESNYRNAAGIVEFCNRRFGCSMKYLGKVQNSQKPIVLNSVGGLQSAIQEENIVIIVKDCDNFKRLAHLSELEDSLEFLDMNATSTDGKKISCYSIFAAKGLEFARVIVFAADMTTNQKIVACTRATEKLYYYE